MEKIGIACFTKRGRELASRLELVLRPEHSGEGFEVLCYEKNLGQWCGKCFEEAEAIIFIGACGIAVRTIAPFLKSKTTDPAVLVLDEGGQFVISLLSGHIGGANEFALMVAEKIGAVPVITTASDVNGKIAVDVFAKKNGLAIGSMTAAKKIAAAVLRGEKVGVYCTGKVEGKVPPELSLLPCGLKRSGDPLPGKNEASGEPTGGPSDCRVSHLIWISESAPTKQQREDYLSDRDGTVLHLIPRSVILGIGCRRGKEAGTIKEIVRCVLEEARIPVQALAGAASIDLKKDEQGILELCNSFGIKFETYPAEALKKVAGDFKASEFVRKTTGVDNVCERAALLAAGTGGKIIRRKYAENGVTAALAVQEWRIRFGE